MSTLLQTDMPQPTMFPNPIRQKPSKTPSKVQSDLIRAPMNRHERQISMLGPRGTADTEIGRPGLR